MDVVLPVRERSHDEIGSSSEASISRVPNDALRFARRVGRSSYVELMRQVKVRWFRWAWSSILK
jgi:hypothetical protein